MRDQLALRVSTGDLERECRILEFKETDIQNWKTQAGTDDTTYRGILAREIVKASEANAQRLIQEARGRGFLSRFRRPS